MSNAYDVEQSELVIKAAKELKKLTELKPPEWAAFVKTGAHKERPPADKGWWYLRAASVLRIIYKLGPIGVSKLRTKYGGKKNRGVRPGTFYKSSGNILRKVLQQLEKEGLVKQLEKEQRKGRIITPKGKSFLDKIATQIAGPRVKKAQPQAKEEKKSEAVKKEAPKKSPIKKETKPEEKTAKDSIKEEKKPKPSKDKVPPTHELAKKK